MISAFRNALGAALALTVFAAAAPAQDSPAAVLAVPCFTCHGAGGGSPGAIPPLSGLSAQEMTAKLATYRAGDPDATIMSRIAKGYTEAELAAVVDYLATHR